MKLPDGRRRITRSVGSGETMPVRELVLAAGFTEEEANFLIVSRNNKTLAPGDLLKPGDSVTIFLPVGGG